MAAKLEFSPKELVSIIDAINERLYDLTNFRSGPMSDRENEEYESLLSAAMKIINFQEV